MPFKEVTMPVRTPKKATLREAAHKDLKEFIALSIGCAEVDICQFHNLNSAYVTYYNLAHNHGYPVTVRRKEGKLYLLRRTQREMTNNDEEEGIYAQTAKRTKPI